MGPPVSRTGWPRTRPSVESNAMQRTLLSPRCWATYKTRRWSWPWTYKEFRIGGRVESKCTSTTAPITWETYPEGWAGVSAGSAFLEAKVRERGLVNRR